MEAKLEGLLGQIERDAAENRRLQEELGIATAEGKRLQAEMETTTAEIERLLAELTHGNARAL
jgi:hypothetical protein